MEQNHFKTFGFLLKCLLLIQLVYFINQHRLGAEASQSDLPDRMTKIETKNLLQEKEISSLKTRAVEDRKEINKLRERVAYLEAESPLANVTTENIIGRAKRPVRLLPARLFYKQERNETEEQMKRFYGPPHNCAELGMLGYTLNGYYLVKGKAQFNNSSKIKTVYCQFKQPPIVKNGSKYETLIGEVDIKSSQVLFSKGVSKINYEITGVNILYDFSNFDTENGFDSDQRFSAPYPGSYFFSITGSFGSNSDPNITLIYFKINENKYGQIRGSKNTPFGGFSYQTVVQLNFGDKVYPFLESGSISTLVFTGWMLDESLENI